MPRPADPNRQKARQTDARHYQGRPCRNGHSGRRYTSTAACVDCVAGRRVTKAADDFEGLL